MDRVTERVALERHAAEEARTAAATGAVEIELRGVHLMSTCAPVVGSEKLQEWPLQPFANENLLLVSLLIEANANVAPPVKFSTTSFCTSKLGET